MKGRLGGVGCGLLQEIGDKNIPTGCFGWKDNQKSRVAGVMAISGPMTGVAGGHPGVCWRRLVFLWPWAGFCFGKTPSVCVLLVVELAAKLLSLGLDAARVDD